VREAGVVLIGWESGMIPEFVLSLLLQIAYTEDRNDEISILYTA
jgi:hypothetical protein